MEQFSVKRIEDSNSWDYSWSNQEIQKRGHKTEQIAIEPMQEYEKDEIHLLR